MTIKQSLTDDGAALTASEKRVARTLLADYPSAGLASVAALAKRAGVSVPTVLRLMGKLGFSGYAAFQEKLIEEVSEQLNSPLATMMRSETADAAPSDAYRDLLLRMAESLRAAAADHRSADFEAILDLLADERSDIRCLGGRFTTILAQRLAVHLGQLRPRVEFIENHTSRLFDQLVDFDGRTTLVVFDYRRYQADVVAFSRLAHEARARIVLFTDRWLSPIAEFADHVLVAPTEGPSPFDSRVVVIAQAEAIIAALVKRHPERSRSRLAAIEDLRSRGAALTAAAETGRDAPE